MWFGKGLSTFILSSVNAFNLDQFKILTFNNQEEDAGNLSRLYKSTEKDHFLKHYLKRRKCWVPAVVSPIPVAGTYISLP